jgi:outer membrane receptor protein involved in Fe transport
VHLRAFHNQLHNAIANINEVQGPGTIGDWGYLPAGGVGARRENLERAEVQGLDAGVEWRLGKGLTASAGWLGSHTNVRRCSLQPTLEGRALPQVPVHQLHLGIGGDYGLWRWNIDCRWVSRQFDDDANQLVLHSAATLDLRITRRLGKHTEIFATLENVTDTEIQTRRDANGTVYTGAPRMWSVGVRREF